eukprot:12175922-Karenia_brevis.AAC.1
MHESEFFQISSGGASASLGSSMHRSRIYDGVSIASKTGSMIYRRQGSPILLMANQATTRL